MLPDEVLKLLKKHDFVTISTSSAKARPNAAPKFLLEVEGDQIYLVDYYVNRTWRNIKVNSYVALTLFDDKTLNGYQIRGTAKVIKAGVEHEKLKKILDEKIQDLSVERIVDAVRSGIRSKSYEISMPARIVILKIKVKEISIIGLAGKIKRESIGRMKVAVKKQTLETKIPTETIPLLLPSKLGQVSKELMTIDPKQGKV